MQELKDVSLTPLWQERIKRARGVARLLSAIPFLRMAGLNGSLVTGTMSRQSDIDFYIATAPNRLYTCRLLTTLAVHLTGWRRYGTKIRGRVCLNRFATTEALDITPHNDYHARVFSGLEPLWAADGVYERYRDANIWMRVFDYNPAATKLPMHQPTIARWLQRAGEWLLGGYFGDWFEERQRSWQQSRIKKDPRTHTPGSRVFVRENELCLHAIKE